LSEPTKHLGALVTGRKLRHGGHPVLRWMASNMVVRQDPNGNLAPDKSKVTERIDGIVALIMGIAVALVNQDKTPEYQVMVFGGRP
jgi:phage terminase large subunit-like protein